MQNPFFSLKIPFLSYSLFLPGLTFFSRVPELPHAFYKTALYLGVHESVPNSNMLYLPCLSGTVLVLVGFIQVNLLSNYSFFFFLN